MQWFRTVTSVPGSLNPLSGISGQQAHKWYLDIHEERIPKHRK